MSDVKQWLSDLGLEKYAPAFSDAEIDFADLQYLTDEDLKEVGLPVGPRRRVNEAIKHLAGSADPIDPAPATPSPAVAGPRAQAEPSSDAERRHLTVVFVDLVGSTEMAGRLDPEDMRNVITGYQNTVAGVVTRYEGFVAKFMGDGVLCYFGWPRANEDDAERAVRAGLDIIAAVRTTSEPNGTALASRVGIATGVVIVGDLIGSGATQEAAVVGETPNLAARLQGLAAPNQIVLPQQTLSLLGNAFALEPLGSHALKGIAEPVDAYAVTGEAARESRFDARQSGTLTPIVGREQELGLMGECWTKAKAGAGQMIVVSGEAGIGKSRITRALIDEIAADDHIRMTYQCSPYHTESAFYPVIQQLSYAAGIHPSDGQGERLDKLENLVGANTRDAALLATLLDIDAAGRQKPLDLSPAQLRAQTMQALIDQLVKQAKEKPLLAVFEDLHWVDPTTLELLDISLDAIIDRKILILATARPTFEHGFGGHPIVTRFALNRLGKDQIQSIVNKLTSGKVLPEEVLAIIAERTDGVPLFIEELTKTILETGVLKPDGNRLVLDGPLDALAIPNTLHDSLMARLDRLQPIKEVAQMAACIGREFGHQLLASISPLRETELETALDGLIKAELIYRRGLPPEATYLFKHALVRDAAYQSLLKETRQRFHGSIAIRMRDQFTETIETQPEILAHHFTEAGDVETALRYWLQAGRNALSRSENYEAIGHLRRGLALLPRGGKRTDQELAMLRPLSTAFMATKGYAAPETIETLDRARTLCSVVEDDSIFPVMFGVWLASLVSSQCTKAKELIAEMHDLAKNADDPYARYAAHSMSAYTSIHTGDQLEAQRHFITSFELGRPFDREEKNAKTVIYGLDLEVAGYAYSAWTEWLLGNPDTALDRHGLALQSLEESDQSYSQARALYWCAVVNQLRGEYQAVVELTNEAIESAREHGLPMVEAACGMMNVSARADLNGDGSADAFTKALDAYFATGARFQTSYHRTLLARMLAREGRYEEGLEVLNKNRQMIRETGEEYFLPETIRLEGELLLAKGGEASSKAPELFQQAIDLAGAGQINSLALRAATSLARWHLANQTPDQAKTVLSPVYSSFTQGLDTRDLEEAASVLAGL